ncbi:MAG: hypothetical protein UY67_C0006G0003 [Candidatus Kaiserbacteria bacterium GW2011_GWA2_52_12]|uniref:N-acetyltransferase domain-containing protein n=2 Tax=Candidatus Kaiseribacteriota TaxID=1752734 RepID=A0A0G1X098_9BACT|nr:MAG: hypothetical protein UY67_C0006G0003 [Candidatus Kaiserbacteria bacterium GW2011_GWA2_52_12]
MKKKKNKQAKKAPLVQVLEWDTEFFGEKMARLSPPIVDIASMKRALNLCKKEGVACLFWRANGSHHENLTIAHHYGFTTNGTRVLYELEAGAENYEATGQVREMTEDDLRTLLRYAALLSNESRFHRDPRFGPKVARKTYRQWLKNMLKDAAPNTKIFVVTVGNEQAGFIACSVQDTAAHIELIYVDKKFRGRSLGKVLLAHALRYYKKSGFPRSWVVTQGSNIPAQRLYQSLGFRIKKMEIDYHKWFN